MRLEEVARQSYGKLVAFLAARTRDVAAAEDALSEAFAEALAHWPVEGVPANPEAWLLTVARRKSVDAARKRQREAGAIWEGIEAVGSESGIPDQRLGLLFACAHPAIEEAVRAPLMLQAVMGLNAERIASAFLMSPSAMGKRLVRAKEKIRLAGILFRVPERDELSGRLDTVLQAVYAAFGEGWSDTGSLQLTEEALFLSRLITELLPLEPEALGLLALMLHAEARRAARRDETGEFVPLAEQDWGRWNWRMIEEAEALLLRAASARAMGRFQLEAALQSAHVARCRTGRNNWAEVLQLYDALVAITGSPVAAVNRALAVAEVEGAQAGLEALEALADDARLSEYQPYWAAGAELLTRKGEHERATEAYERAIELERDPAVRRYLHRRLEANFT